MLGLKKLAVSVKSKINSLRRKKGYKKVEKSDNIKKEIRSKKVSKKVKKPNEENLKLVESPKSDTFVL
jgi:hypothetical protein